MGRVYDGIDDGLAAFIRAQRIFFVATAPLDAGGHVNCSPKGLEGLAILGPCEVAYRDLTGSGAETIAHLRENGRITLMFCAFEEPPRVVRLAGRGRAIAHDAPEFAALAARFPPRPGARAVIHVRIDRIADSCGYAVPHYTYAGERAQLDAWAARKGLDGLTAFRAAHNTRSIDGLPALDRP